VERGEDILKGAQRELREEIGLSAAHWLEVLDMVPSGTVTDDRQVAFIAWGFERAERDPDPQEVLQIKRVPFGEPLAMALTGQIRDAGTIAVFATTALKASRGELPAEIVRRVI
jgi:8-oxo-dGTP pyrophosphatase MutT (NUDIX family)